MTGVAPANPVRCRTSSKRSGRSRPATPIEGAPAIVGGVVYVASLDKHLYALDLATGKEKWKVKLGADEGVAEREGRPRLRRRPRRQVPLRERRRREGALEVRDRRRDHGRRQLPRRQRPLRLARLDPLLPRRRTARRCGQSKVDGPVNAAAAVVGDRTFVAGCDSILHVIDAKTGKELGTIDLGGQAVATAAVVGDRVYVGDDGEPGRRGRSEDDEEGRGRSRPRSGSSRSTPRPPSPTGSVVAGSRDKKVYAIDAKTGQRSWNFATDGQVDASPVIVGDRVYVGCLSSDGNFYVLDLKTGKKIQELEPRRGRWRLGRRRPGLHPGRHRQGHAVLPRAKK